MYLPANIITFPAEGNLGMAVTLDPDRLSFQRRLEYQSQERGEVEELEIQ